MKITTTLFVFFLSYGITNYGVANPGGAQVTTPESSTAKKPRVLHYTPLNATGKKIRQKNDTARCVLDRNTGLVWELKTDDDGIHDKDKDYRWGGKGAEGVKETETVSALLYDDWNLLVDGTNKEKLCGFKDWRVPTIDELKSLVIPTNQPLTIDTRYFSQTLVSPYWSASAYTHYPEHAQTVHFGNGTSHYYNGYKGNRLPLRLVRGKLKTK